MAAYIIVDVKVTEREAYERYKATVQQTLGEVRWKVRRSRWALRNSRRRLEAKPVSSPRIREHGTGKGLVEFR